MVAELATFENWPRALAPRATIAPARLDVPGDLAALGGAAAVTAEISQIERAIERKPTASSRPLQTRQPHPRRPLR